MSDVGWVSKEQITAATSILYENINYSSDSSEEPPREEWSSLDLGRMSTKSLLSHKSVLSPGSGEICAKYITQSASSILRHPYYKYPSLTNPGIEAALFGDLPAPHEFPLDGKELYLDICSKTNQAPVRKFYENLLNSKINLKYYYIASLNVRAMAIALEKNTYVKTIDLTENFLDLDACYHLGQMIKINSTIEELILESCRIGEPGLLRLFDGVRNKSIKTVNLARNELGDDGGEYFAKLIELGAQFTRIDLRHNELGTKTASALAESLEANNVITHLDLSFNPFFEWRSFVKFLDSMSLISDKLVELKLNFAGLDHTLVATAIAEVTTIPTLKFLYLRDNNFRDECAPLLVKKLPFSNLNTYDLSNNPFSPDGACAILKIFLRAKVKVRNMYLDNVCVNRPFIALLNQVKRMKSRKKFVITFDKILHDWVAVGKDPRELVLRRIDYLGRQRKVPKNVPLFLLSLTHAAEREGLTMIRAKEFVVMMKHEKMPVNDDWVAALIDAFPGPIVDSKPTVQALLLRDYMRRLWPDMRLPDDWVPPVMIRVDVKRKKKAVQSSRSALQMKDKGKGKDRGKGKDKGKAKGKK